MALGSKKDKKAVGVDTIPAELLQNVGKRMKEQLCMVIGDCYDKGDFPSEFVRSRLITFPKTSGVLYCSNYRTFSFLSHAKILLHVVKNRFKRKIEEYVKEDQFGFRSKRGTREAILALRIILERSVEVNRRDISYIY